MYHQRIVGDFEKPTGCKGGFDAEQICVQYLFQLGVVDIAGGDL
jgi:hypothetical protein